nr:uncharacterized protein LOC109156749 [Ipomoea batatas]
MESLPTQSVNHWSLYMLERDSDLLERSTRKRKVSEDDSGNTTVVSDEVTPPEQQSPAEVVAETPLIEHTGTAMQIENDGVVPADLGAEMTPPAPVAGALPRSYMDSVVGSGADSCPHKVADQTAVEAESGQAMVDHTTSTPRSATPVVSTTAGTNAAQRPKPYGSWMLVTRKERRQSVQVSGPANRIPGGGAGNDRGASGSRYAPLETVDGSGTVPAIATQAQPRRRADKQPVVSGSAVVRNQATPRMANVIVNERQIVNDRAESQTGTQVATEQATRRHMASGSRSRRAAEKDEHVVVRGENGGQVVNSTKVVNGESPEMTTVASTETSPEHHADPPDALDVEGDVVMEIENQTRDNQMEGYGFYCIYHYEYANLVNVLAAFGTTDAHRF